MKKNNKGFTLIEVIAVVALLGIMALVAVPKIYELVSGSRNEVYIQDAKRFISKTQYEMSAGADKIEKPDLDECIVVSLNYLGARDFKNAPNKGEYLSDSSFVVVRNVSGKYYYSAMLVEKKPDNTYIGVELSSEKELAKKSAKEHVRAITEDELIYINDNNATSSDGNVIDMANYINDKINTVDSEKDLWVTESEEVVGYYYGDNNTGGDESGVSVTKPRISARFGSNDGSLKTSLSVTATDSDDANSSLTMCLKISKEDNSTYPNPLGDEERDTYCFPYGSETTHIVDIDLSSTKYGGFTYNDKKAYFYIVVSDPQNNISSKKLQYNIHSNSAPVISKFEISKGSGNKYNMPKAELTIDVTDDLDALNDLEVCLWQDKASDTLNKQCSDYVPFNSIFTNGNTGYYVFREQTSNGWQNISIPDGTTHTLDIYVRDSYGLVSTESSSYSIYKNKSPQISEATIQGVPVVIDGVSVGNSLTATITLKIIDESSNDKIQLKFDNDNNKTMSYAEFLNGNRQYTFPGTLDGVDRTLTITVTDEFGATSTKKLTLTNIYKSSSPNINIKSITSSAYPCEGASTCFDPNNGGNLMAYYSLDLSDDSTSILDLKICVSENANDCIEKNTQNFVKNNKGKKVYTFKNYSNKYEYSPGEIDERKLYAAAIDDDGLYSGLVGPVTYNVYHNYPPQISGSYSVSVSKKTNTYQTLLFDFDNFFVEDDFTNFKSSFCYKYSTESEAVCTKYDSFNAMKSSLLNGVDHDFSKGNISLYFVFTDNYNKSSQSEVVVKNAPTDGSPVITSLSVNSTDQRYNSNNFKVNFKVSDQDDTYKVCITENSSSCSNYVTYNGEEWFSGDLTNGQPTEYSLTINGEKQFNWSSSYEENTNRKTIYLYVMDSHGNVVSKNVDYILYKLCSNKDSMVVDFSSNDYSPLNDTNSINVNNCMGACYHNYETTSNKEHLNYLTDINNFSSLYSHTITYTDNLVNKKCTINETKPLYCDYADCFAVDNDKKATYIDLNIYDEEKVWTYTTTSFSANNSSSSDECVDPANQLFNVNDYRCNDSKYCKNKAKVYCDKKCEEEEKIAYEEYLAERNENLKAYEALMLEKYRKEFEFCSCNTCSFAKLCNPSGGGDVSARRIFSFKESINDGSSGYSAKESYIIYDVDCKDLTSLANILSLCQKRSDAGKPITNCLFTYYKNKPEEVPSCSEYVGKSMKQLINADLEQYLADYPEFSFSCTEGEESITETCLADAESSCSLYLSTFCAEPSTTAKVTANCSDSDIEGPYYCNTTGYSDGYCLGDVDTCEEGTDNCQKVCYKTKECNVKKETKTFLCHGYFKSYWSTTNNGNMTLQETGLKVCPDYYRLYPEKFSLNTNSNKPYLLFNGDEQEVK